MASKPGEAGLYSIAETGPCHIFVREKNITILARTAALLITVAAIIPPAAAFGPDAHRIIAQLAGPHLLPQTRIAIQQTIGEESLSEAVLWPDKMRSNPAQFWQEIAGPYHYVTVPPGTSYPQVGAPPQGDAVTALAEFRQTLRNPDSPLAERQLALRFSVHIVADLHQPLHVGNGKDRGGNLIDVLLNGEKTNLHRVWDGDLLEGRNLSVDQWVSFLGETMNEQQVQAWNEENPLIWVAESAVLRDGVYPSSSTLDQVYVEQHLPTLYLRMQQAAVRTAAYLNGLWSGCR